MLVKLMFLENNLVLYKNHPARVIAVSEKIEIRLPDNKSKRVRPKDIVLIHQGPLKSLDILTSQDADVHDAWEILIGEITTLAELTDLIFDENTPATAWATWQILSEDLYFTGSPDRIEARSVSLVDKIKQEREKKAADASQWADFLSRVETCSIIEADHKFLSDVEMFALSRQPGSRIMQALKREETIENAHQLLLKLGFWNKTKNPYPQRFSMDMTSPAHIIEPLGDKNRRDLTHLPAFAIDDEGNEDPDDAISLDGERLWVHVADVAAIVQPDSEIDLEARGRGANLYLPEQVVTMLPIAITEQLGLGLQEISPALSFGIDLDKQNGEIKSVEIVPSKVRVTRMTYEAANQQLSKPPLSQIYELATCFHQRRQAKAAAPLDLPEVKVFVDKGGVSIYPIKKLASRTMITDLMLMAGEAAARFALDHQIVFPYATQAPPATAEIPETMAQMFAYRKQFKRSQLKCTPEPHSGLGIDHYSQVTSPLRRYLDLFCHQQLRAFIAGDALMDNDSLLMRIGEVEAIVRNVRQSERLSNKHWTLVYLMNNPDWQGQGFVVDKQGKRGTVLIPELALEANIRVPEKITLNTEVNLQLREVDLPRLSAYFQVQ